MFKLRYKYSLMIVLLLFAITVTCRKPYLPDALVKSDNYLVVDGIINTSPGGVTTILLSRTKNLTDTVVSIPESGAQVTIQDAAGSMYHLSEQGTAGTYASSPLFLNNNTQYRLLITTSSNKKYASDLVTTRVTPPIDSVSWVQDTIGVHVYANTHDPSNNTRYYRWQYVLTFEYQSQLETPWGLSGNTIYVRDFNNLIHICYNTINSTRVLLGTSAALSQDVISLAKLLTIPQNDSIIAYRLSINVKQFALTQQCYGYWQIIQKNSEQLGTLFDLQPSQLEGNIHSLSNSIEPVVGFVSAGTMEEKRIFISKADVIDWVPPPGGYNCVIRSTPTNPIDFSIWSYPDPTYIPWYFSGGSLNVAKKECLDCRLSGGTTTKPSFW